jgi:hypothetical protein
MGLLLLSRADLRHVTAAVRKGLLYYTGPIADTGDCTELYKFGHFIQMCLKRQTKIFATEAKFCTSIIGYDIIF